MLRVELGGQSPTGESAVELLLSQPGREFPVSVEAEARAHMPNDVVDGSKSVVRAAEVAAQKWVTALPLSGAGGTSSTPRARTAPISSSSES